MEEIRSFVRADVTAGKQLQASKHTEHSLTDYTDVANSQLTTEQYCMCE